MADGNGSKGLTFLSLVKMESVREKAATSKMTYFKNQLVSGLPE